VMHPWTVAHEKSPHRRLLTERGEELDPARADEDGRGLDALVVDARTMLELGTEETLVGIERVVQVVNGDAEMMNAADAHGIDATGALALRRREHAHGADRL
jgi:hypothetical protein